jgi:hypothetical protein
VEDKLPRVNALLTQAIGNLRTYHEMVANEPPSNAWQALYLPLTLLLGKALTRELQDARELQHSYEYIGNAFASARWANDHVVPMSCIIARLRDSSVSWPKGARGVAILREFMSQHIVMARIPNSLNALLVPAAMPNDVWWQPVHDNFSNEAKQMALWGRYIVAIPDLVIPLFGVEDFVPGA